MARKDGTTLTQLWIAAFNELLGKGNGDNFSVQDVLDLINEDPNIEKMPLRIDRAQRCGMEQPLRFAFTASLKGIETGTPIVKTPNMQWPL